MRTMKFFAAGAAALMLAAGAAAAQADTTISNGPANSSISSFGFSDSQTYGQVFTSPETGALTSFTMYLDGGIGGTLYGGIGEWNGTSDFNLGGGVSNVLYTSSAVAADHGGAYTFAPNVGLTSGHLYVAFLSVFGVDHTGQGTTSMPLSSAGFGGHTGAPFNYFVWNNTNGGPSATSWNYFGNFGDARLDATIKSGAVPEPATWAMMIAGFGLAGATLRRRRALAA